ncbi:MAG: hypothetical protein JWP57_317 [Spirosoma sp.]|nr:hypothetical protein [Spirosoma sp.]
MTTSRLFTYLLLLMIGGLLSCSDHPFQPLVTPGSTANRLRVKTLTLDLPNNQAKVSSFRYDGQGRLSQILTYQTPDSTVSAIEINNYTYDGQNRLTGLQREAVPYPRQNRPNFVYQYIYLYNAAGQVIGLNQLNSFSLTFGYNSANQLAGGSRLYAISGLTISGSNSFTFTGNNLIRSSDSRNIPTRSGTPDPIVTTVDEYTHDDKINPFYGVYLIPYPNEFSGPSNMAKTYFGGLDNFLTLSRNNVLTQLTSSSTTSFGSSGPSTLGLIESAVYQYQYNAASLPTVRVKTTTRPGGPTFPSVTTVETLRFEYESY